MNVKRSTPRKMEALFSYRGHFFLIICLHFTPRTAQTAVMMAPLAGKHDSNEDELGTQLVNAVFAEKSSAKVF